MSIDQLPLPDAACRAIVRQAVEWIIAQIMKAPPQCMPLVGDLEWPTLHAAEESLNTACLTGDQAQTKDAARAYCVAWRDAIKARRETTAERTSPWNGLCQRN